MDEQWSYVGNKSNQRWLWYAVDHTTNMVLAYVFGKRKDEVFKELKTLLEPFYRLADNDSRAVCCCVSVHGSVSIALCPSLLQSCSVIFFASSSFQYGLFLLGLDGCKYSQCASLALFWSMETIPSNLLSKCCTYYMNSRLLKHALNTTSRSSG